MSVNYPVAANAEAALNAPAGRAARERDARDLAGAPVTFVRELTGPAFETRAAAEAAYAPRLDVQGRAIAPEDRYCDLAEVALEPARREGQAEPVYEAGHRWPRPRRLVKTVWRLSIGYWRIADPSAATGPVAQARTVRRTAGEALDPTVLRAMAGQPLRPVKPQQPLDIGLFEVRPPDAPHLVIPDE